MSKSHKSFLEWFGFIYYNKEDAESIKDEYSNFLKKESNNNEKEIQNQKEKLQYYIDNENYFLGIVINKIAAYLTVITIVEAIITKHIDGFLSPILQKLKMYGLCTLTISDIFFAAYILNMIVLIFVLICCFIQLTKEKLSDYKDMKAFNSSVNIIIEKYYDDYIKLEKLRIDHTNVLTAMNWFLTSLVPFTVYILEMSGFTGDGEPELSCYILVISGGAAIAFLILSIIIAVKTKKIIKEK